MAEALCGPSNPLQSFQKHASTDRTLQQDRFLPSRSPIQASTVNYFKRSFLTGTRQGFRSPPQIPPSQVEAEFEAFQKGQLLFPGQVHEPDLPFHPEPSLAHNLPPSWATDFERLRLTDPRSFPIPSSQFRHEAPMQKSSLGGWHQEFMNQVKLDPAASRSRTDYTSRASSMYMPRMNTPAYYNGGSHISPVGQGKQPIQPAEQVFDDAAFERAFDAASRDMLEQESAARTPQEQNRSKYELINEQLQNEKGLQDETALRDADSTQQEPSGVTEQNPAQRDYQIQLELLKRQNIRRLYAARAEQGQAAIGSDSDAQQAQQTVEQQQEASSESRAFSQNHAFQDYGKQLQELSEQKAARLRRVREQQDVSGINPNVQQTQRREALVNKALEDYKLQLSLAEQQNKRRLLNSRDPLNKQLVEEQQKAHQDAQAAAEANELARTAGQLLDNLKDEKSEKFKQSNFMQLMRQLRDKEVMVEGENIVPVSSR